MKNKAYIALLLTAAVAGGGFVTVQGSNGTAKAVPGLHAVESSPESIAESMIEPVESVVESVVESIIEPVESAAESVVESVVESVEHIAEPVVEVESVAEPTIEPVESVIESIAEPVESIVESIAEAVVEVESVAEPTIEPVESVVESIAEPVESIVESIAEAVVEVESVAEPTIEPVESVVESVAEPVESIVESVDNRSEEWYVREAETVRSYEVSTDGSFETLLTTGNYRVGIDIPAGTYHINTVNGGGSLTVIKPDPLDSGKVQTECYQFILPPAVHFEAVNSTDVKVYELKNHQTKEEHSGEKTLSDLIKAGQGSETAGQYSEALDWELTEGTVLQVRANLMLKLQTEHADLTAFCKRVQDLDGSILLHEGKYTAGTEFPSDVYDIVDSGETASVEVDTGEGSTSFTLAEDPTGNEIKVFRNMMLSDGTTLTTDEKIKLIPKVRVLSGR